MLISWYGDPNLLVSIWPKNCEGPSISLPSSSPLISSPYSATNQPLEMQLSEASLLWSEAKPVYLIYAMTL